MSQQRRAFWRIGGRYVPETLTRALDELAAEYDKPESIRPFRPSSTTCLHHYVGRPSPLYHPAAERGVRRAQIYLKRGKI